MEYRNPKFVNSPRAHVEVVKIIYDGGVNSDDFSIAIIKWDGCPRIGVRWNISSSEYEDERKMNGQAECIGNPTSRGVPTWFVLPFNGPKEPVTPFGMYLDIAIEELNKLK